MKEENNRGDARRRCTIGDINHPSIGQRPKGRDGGVGGVMIQPKHVEDEITGELGVALKGYTLIFCI